MIDIDNSKCALIFGCNYSNSGVGWKTYQSENDAKKMHQLLLNTYKFSKNNCHLILASQCTYRNIIKELNWITNQKKKIKVIYFAGHGCPSGDNDGDEKDRRDENWQTWDHRNLRDDIITDIIAKDYSGMTPIYTVISDSCHSRTIIDVEKLTKCPNVQGCVCIGAAQDHQSALQTGDGSVMTYYLLKLLKNNPHQTYKMFEKNLDKSIKESFVGNLQDSDVIFSHSNLQNIKIFAEK